VKKTIFSIAIGLIILIGVAILILANNYTHYEGYVVQKIGSDKIWVVPGNSIDDAVEKHEKDSELGMIFIDVNDEIVEDLIINQKVKVYHSKKVYASAPGRVKPFYIRKRQTTPT